MDKDEALKLALEALKEHEGNYMLGKDGVVRHVKAIDACEQALAAPVQEPVAWQHTDRLGGVQVFTNEPPPGLKKKCRPLIFGDTTPPAAPVQPVARVHTFIGREWAVVQVLGEFNLEDEFYTAPPAAQTTTEESLAVQSAPVQEPESFEQWNAKQHGDPEEIGFLQALRIAYCSGQDSVTKTAAQPAPVQDDAWKSEQKALAGEAIKCATEAIADADGPIKTVREYYGAQPAPVQQTWPVSQDPLTQLQVACIIAERDSTSPAQPAPVQEPHPTVYVYRLESGGTQVMAPNINDPALVIDMLEQALVAMSDKGRPITRN